METRGSNRACRKFTPQDDSDVFRRACGHLMILHRNDHGHPIAGVRSVAKPAPLPRTQFSEYQKARMAEFADSTGWRIKRNCNGTHDEMLGFCRDIGVTLKCFKQWVHHNRQKLSSSAAGSIVATATTAREDGGSDVDTADGSAEEEEEERA
ncbi:hypothetical protein GW17_00024147 [Ensete ventricosum]|nr:hypothetical protein GW17_00024147 [Ensete ventricosum]